MNTTFILGAGFSIPANFPCGKTLNEKFFKNIENRLLRHSSSEWAWDDYDEATSNNGRINYDYLRISFLLSELVEQYQKETSLIFDYEEFYDWFLSKWGNYELMEICCNSVNERLIMEFKIDSNSPYCFNNVLSNQFLTINECYNYLIADLIGRPYAQEEKKNEYTNFIKLVKTSEQVNIFSLNHDLLLEYLFKENSINFSDGFNIENSCIVGEKNENLPMFDNSYKENTKLYKLHGSIDYFKFEELILKELINYRTGQYWFFKPLGYHNKHYAKRIRPSTGELVQDFNNNTVPQFLTGKNKFAIINQHLVFKPIYENFIKSFSQVQRIVIIGYSYRDVHINKIIKEGIDNGNLEIININPIVKFPFRKNYSSKFVKELESIYDLY